MLRLVVLFYFAADRLRNIFIVVHYVALSLGAELQKALGDTLSCCQLTAF